MPLAVLAQRTAGMFQMSSDPSFDLLLHLAAAYGALERMKNEGVDTQVGNRLVVIDALERAYREAAYLRGHRVPNSMLDTSTLSRFSRLYGSAKL